MSCMLNNSEFQKNSHENCISRRVIVKRLPNFVITDDNYDTTIVIFIKSIVRIYLNVRSEIPYKNKKP